MATDDGMTLMAFDDEPIPRRWHGARHWGGWRLDDAHLWHGGYCFGLAEVTSSAKMLDMIMQIAGKSWADDACLAGLVRAFDDIFHPQSLLCSRGTDKRITAKDVRARLKRAEACVAENGDGGEWNDRSP